MKKEEILIDMPAAQNQNQLQQRQSPFKTDKMQSKQRFQKLSFINFFTNLKKKIEGIKNKNKEIQAAISQYPYEPGTTQANNEREYIELIIQKDLFFMPQQWKQQFNSNLEKLILNTQINDRKALGSLVGVAVLGLIGFVALGFTIVGVIAGGIVGGVVGGYAGKKIKKKMNRNKKLIFFEFYQISLNCHLQLCYNIFNDKNAQIGLNEYRFNVEKLIEEFRIIIFYRHLFSQKIQKRINKIMKKFQEFMLRTQVATTIRLTLKLSKYCYKNQIYSGDQIVNTSVEQRLAEVIAKVLQPSMRFYAELLKDENRPKKYFDGELVILLKKIQAFLFIPGIVEIQNNYQKMYELNQANIQEQVKEMEQEMTLSELKQKIKSLLQHSESEINGQDNEQSNKKEQPQSQLCTPQKGITIQQSLQQSQKSDQKVNSCSQKDSKVEIDSYQDPKSEIFLERNDVVLPKIQDFNQGINNEKDVNKKHQNQEIPSEICLEDNAQQQPNLQQLGNNEQKFEKQQKSLEEEKKTSCQKNTQQQCVNNENQSSSNEQNKGLMDMATVFGKKLKIHKMNSTNSCFNQESEDIKECIIKKQNSNSSKMSIGDGKAIQEAQCSAAKVHSNQDLDQVVDKELRKSISIIKQDIPLDAQQQQQTAKDSEIEQKFEELRQLYIQDAPKTWEKVITKKAITIYKKMIPPNPCVLVRAESDIEGCEIYETYQQIYCPKLRQKWDGVALEFQIFDQIDDKSDFLYFVIDPGLGVTRRDFVQKRSVRWDFPGKGQVTIIFFSGLHPLKPERKNHLRAQTYIAGYTLTPINEGKECHLTMITQVDVKGIVPRYIINFVAARQPPKWIEQLQAAVLNYRKEQQIENEKKENNSTSNNTNNIKKKQNI